MRLSKSPRKRWRRAVFAVVFAVRLVRVSLANHWGSHAQHYPDTSKPLLSASDQPIPRHYFSGMPNSLPPGWLLGNLSAELVDQIKTFAKNKLAHLFTPVARLVAYRRFKNRVSSAAEQRLAPSLTPELLASRSAFFSVWDPILLAELIASPAVRIRVYAPGEWALHASRRPFFFQNAAVVLEGSAVSIDALAPNAPEAPRRPFDVVEEARAFLQSPSRAGLLAVAPLTVAEFDYKAVVSLSKMQIAAAGPAGVSLLLASSARASLSVGSPPTPPLSSSARRSTLSTPQPHARPGASPVAAHNSAGFRAFVTSRLLEQMRSEFALTPAVLAAASPFFAAFDNTVLETLVAAAKPHVAFAGGSLRQSTAGEPLTDVLILARGAATVHVSLKGHQKLVQDAAEFDNLHNPLPLMGGGGGRSLPPSRHAQRPSSAPASAHRRSTAASPALTGSVNAATPSSADHNALAKTRLCQPQFYSTIPLRPGDSFGDDFVVFDDPCPHRIIATECTQFWNIPRLAVVAHVKSASDKAKQRREEFLRRSRPQHFQEYLLQTRHSVIGRLPHAVIAAIAAAMEPCVLRPGERFASVHDDMSVLLLLVSGRINVLLMGNEPTQQQQQQHDDGGGGGGDSGAHATQFLPGSLVGEAFLTHAAKWRHSYSATRLCEGWTITRRQTWAILDAHNAGPLAHRLLRKRGGEARPSSPSADATVTSAPKVMWSPAPPTLGHTYCRPCNSARAVQPDPSQSHSPRRPTTPREVVSAAEQRASIRNEKKRAQARELEEQLAVAVQREARQRTHLAHTVLGGKEVERAPLCAGATLSSRGVATVVNDSSRGGGAETRALFARAREQRMKSRQQHSAQSATGAVEITVERGARGCTGLRVVERELRSPRGSRAAATAEEQQHAARLAARADMAGRIAQEVRNQEQLARRRKEAAEEQERILHELGGTVADAGPSASDADTTTTRGGRRRRAGGATFASVSKAERTVVSEILKRHANAIREQRTRCSQEATEEAVRSRNPFTSLHRRAAHIPRVTPFGELYLEAASPSRGSSAAGTGHRSRRRRQRKGRGQQRQSSSQESSDDDDYSGNRDDFNEIETEGTSRDATPAARAPRPSTAHEQHRSPPRGATSARQSPAGSPRSQHTAASSRGNHYRNNLPVSAVPFDASARQQSLPTSYFAVHGLPATELAA